MLKKSYSKTGRSCRVTFKVPSEISVVEGSAAEKVAVLGDWNGWSAEEDPLKARKDGSFSTTLSLESGKRYRFRYLSDESQWINDDTADELVPNRFGGYDCVVSV